FKEMKRRMGIEPHEDILHSLTAMTGARRAEANAVVLEMEAEALSKTQLQTGLHEVMTFLEKQGLPKAILTRNTDASVEHVLANHLPEYRFHPIVTRAFEPIKPSPAGIHHIASVWQLQASEVMMVGDGVDDIEAGRAAGSVTVLVRNAENGHVASLADHVVDSLEGLIGVVAAG
ncbi:HAD-like domain-containing protein, partial [Blyttiomyces helicus]